MVCLRLRRFLSNYLIYICIAYILLCLLYLLIQLKKKKNWNDLFDTPLLRESFSTSSSFLSVSLDESDSTETETKPVITLNPISNSENDFSSSRSSGSDLIELSHKVILDNYSKRIDDLLRNLTHLKDENSRLEHELDQLKGVPTTSISNNDPMNGFPQSPGGDGGSIDSSYSKLTFFKDLPSSSIFCSGSHLEQRVCKIKNLYFNPTHETYFIIRGNSSVFYNVPPSTDPLVDLSSLSEHSVFFFKYYEMPEGCKTNITVRFVQEKSFILKRFHTGNIMHAMHDDFICLYFHLKQYASGPSLHDQNSYGGSMPPFDKNHHIFFIDGFPELGYGDAVVGQSKLVNWYQYGFSIPQGPIKNKTVSGYQVREAASYALKNFSLPAWDREGQAKVLSYLSKVAIAYNGTYRSYTNTPEPLKRLLSLSPRNRYIAIFSRRNDRLILNEQDFASVLEKTFNLPVKFIRNEDLTFNEQVAILRETVIAIGMHGSLLIMGMFLPPGAILIEVYPLCVPSENYTPYKTMCHLHGMELTYRSWVNKYPELNVPHPEYHLYHGGIGEFNTSLQQSIINTCDVPTHLCCMDPYWLYRIYQDTSFHIPDIMDLIFDAILTAKSNFHVKGISNVTDVTPVVVTKKNFQCFPVIIAKNSDYLKNLSHSLFIGEAKLSLKLEWEKPWNTPYVDEYAIWVHQLYQEIIVPKENATVLDNICLTHMNQEINIWIRAKNFLQNTNNNDNHTNINNTIFSPWSEKLTCSCKIPADYLESFSFPTPLSPSSSVTSEL